MSLPRLLHRFLRDDSGSTAIEYGLIAALITVAAIASYERLGNHIVDVFAEVGTTMSESVQ